MKRVLTLLTVFALLLTCVLDVGAVSIGDVVNKTVYTDIVAKINGQDIASFNVDGYTVVVAEDLRNYGFEVEWKPDERALHISKNELADRVASTYVAPRIPAYQVGKKANDVLYSDIKTYLNGALITSYNIGGQTVIYFNDLACYGIVEYNNSTRTLSATFPWMKGPIVWYSSSMYRIGTDIPAGDYYAVATNLNYAGYYCKYTDSSQSDIEDNDNFNNFTFFRCYDGQYLKLSRCKITPAENAPVNIPANGVYGEATYRVGIDMPAGEYMFTATDSKYSGYYCAYSDITYDDIVDNDNFSDVAYYTVSNGQYVKLSRCTAVLVKATPTSIPASDINTEVNEEQTMIEADDEVKFSLTDVSNLLDYTKDISSNMKEATTYMSKALKERNSTMKVLYCQGAVGKISLTCMTLKSAISILENRPEIEFESGDTLLSLAEGAYEELKGYASMEIDSSNVDEQYSELQSAIFSTKHLLFSKAIVTFAESVLEQSK